MSRKMSEEHRKAIAAGRAEARAVRDYLDTLTASAATRHRSPEQIRAKVAEVQARIAAETNPATKVELIQRRLDLEASLAQAATEVDRDELEGAFVAAAAGFSARKGISYTAWREAGVPAAVLRRAGVPRTRRATVAAA